MWCIPRKVRGCRPEPPYRRAEGFEHPGLKLHVPLGGMSSRLVSSTSAERAADVIARRRRPGQARKDVEEAPQRKRAVDALRVDEHVLAEEVLVDILVCLASTCELSTNL